MEDKNKDDIRRRLEELRKENNRRGGGNRGKNQERNASSTTSSDPGPARLPRATGRRAVAGSARARGCWPRPVMPWPGRRPIPRRWPAANNWPRWHACWHRRIRRCSNCNATSMPPGRRAETPDHHNLPLPCSHRGTERRDLCHILDCIAPAGGRRNANRQPDFSGKDRGASRYRFFLAFASDQTGKGIAHSKQSLRHHGKTRGRSQPRGNGSAR